MAVLVEPLTNGNPFNEWDPRANIGIHLGKSPLHAKNIALVLDRKTGYVSPQFHVVFDEHFTTAKDFSTGSDWQLKTGLFQQESTNVLQNQRENTPIKKSVAQEPAPIMVDQTNKNPTTGEK